MSTSSIRGDLVTLLSTVLGRAAAEQKVTDVEALVSSKAATGAAAGVDARLSEIRATVDSELRKRVAPLFLGAIFTAVVAVVVGGVAITSRRRRA